MLSAVMLKPGALDEVTDLLKAEHFYSEAHKHIFEAACDLSVAGQPIDTVQVATWLRDRDRLAIVGGAAYIAQIEDASPSLRNIRAHASSVREKWRLRELARICWQTAAECYGDVGEVQSFIDQTEAKLSALGQTDVRADLVSIGESIVEVFSAVEKHGGGGHGLPLGPTEFQSLTLGFAGGDLLVVAGRPGMGKSALAMQWACEVSSAHDHLAVPLGAIVFSAEMTHTDLSTRAVCSVARVDANKLKSNQVTDGEWARLTQAAHALSAGRLKYYDRAGMTPIEIRSKSRRYAAELERQGARLGVVVIDYLQLLNGSDLVGKNASREQEVSKMSSYFKQLAKELRAPVVLLSQLSRKCEERVDKRPMLSDLRESGAIEQDADCVVFVFREEYYKGDKATDDIRNVAELIVAKRRGNRTGTAKVRFDAQFTSFADLPTGHPALDSNSRSGGAQW